MSLRLKIAACDDERTALRIITGAAESAFRELGTEPEIDTFLSAKALQNAMGRETYDLLLLDVDMPELDGVAFGAQLRAQRCEIPIVYVSNREDRVFECFPVHPFGFIRKGQFIKDMTAVAKAFVAEYSRTHGERSLVVTEHGRPLSIPIHDILYIEGASKQQIVRLQEGAPITINQSMNQIEEHLHPYGFLRVHKGYLVNYHFIRRLTATDVILTNGTSVPLSRRKESEIKLQYMELIQGDGSIIL